MCASVSVCVLKGIRRCVFTANLTFPNLDQELFFFFFLNKKKENNNTDKKGRKGLLKRAKKSVKERHSKS